MALFDPARSGGAISAEVYQQARTVSRPEIERRLTGALKAHGAQAIVQPTTPCTAPLVDQLKVVIAGREVDTLVLANYTVVASLLGLSGISLPIGLSQAGLPVGLELDAPVNSDLALLDLAHQIEGALVER